MSASPNAPVLSRYLTKQPAAGVEITKKQKITSEAFGVDIKANCRFLYG
jgi:hypothetical protein